MILLISSSTCSTAEKIGTYQFPFSTEKKRYFLKLFWRPNFLLSFAVSLLLVTCDGIRVVTDLGFCTLFFLKIFSIITFQTPLEQLNFQWNLKITFFSHFRALSVQNFGLKSIGIWVHYSACGLNVPSTEIQFLSLIWKK